MSLQVIQGTALTANSVAPTQRCHYPKFHGEFDLVNGLAQTPTDSGVWAYPMDKDFKAKKPSGANSSSIQYIVQKFQNGNDSSELFSGGSQGSCSARSSSRVIGRCAGAVNIDLGAGIGAPRIMRRQMARRKWAKIAP